MYQLWAGSELNFTDILVVDTNLVDLASFQFIRGCTLDGYTISKKQGSEVGNFRGLGGPGAPETLSKGGGRSPPFSIGFPAGGGRIDPQNRRFQDRCLKNKKLRTSGIQSTRQGKGFDLTWCSSFARAVLYTYLVLPTAGKRTLKRYGCWDGPATCRTT